jgi:hypothetical protein
MIFMKDKTPTGTTNHLVIPSRDELYRTEGIKLKSRDISLVEKIAQCLAVLDYVSVYRIQGAVLELEPLLHQLRRRQAHSRLLQELIVTGPASLITISNNRHASE